MELVSPVASYSPSQGNYFHFTSQGGFALFTRNLWLLWGVAGAPRAPLVLSYSSTCRGHHLFTWSQDTAPSFPCHCQLELVFPDPTDDSFKALLHKQDFVSKPDVSARMRIKVKENPKLFLLASVSWNTFSLTCAYSKQNRNAGEYPLSQKTHGNMVKNKLQTCSQLV